MTGKDKKHNSRKVRNGLSRWGCDWGYLSEGEEGKAGGIVNSMGLSWESRDFREYNQDKLGLYNNKLKYIFIKNLRSCRKQMKINVR